MALCAWEGGEEACHVEPCAFPRHAGKPCVMVLGKHDGFHKAWPVAKGLWSKGICLLPANGVGEQRVQLKVHRPPFEGYKQDDLGTYDKRGIKVEKSLQSGMNSGFGGWLGWV
eukprot:708619-Pelagomonas_calceolata.AAC.1